MKLLMKLQHLIVDEAVELALADDVDVELAFADDFNATVFDDLAAEVVATEATWLSELFDTLFAATVSALADKLPADNAKAPTPAVTINDEPLTTFFVSLYTRNLRHFSILRFI